MVLPLRSATIEGRGGGLLLVLNLKHVRAVTVNGLGAGWGVLFVLSLKHVRGLLSRSRESVLLALNHNHYNTFHVLLLCTYISISLP